MIAVQDCGVDNENIMECSGTVERLNFSDGKSMSNNELQNQNQNFESDRQTALNDSGDRSIEGTGRGGRTVFTKYEDVAASVKSLALSTDAAIDKDIQESQGRLAEMFVNTVTFFDPAVVELANVDYWLAAGLNNFSEDVQEFLVEKEQED